MKQWTDIIWFMLKKITLADVDVVGRRGKRGGPEGSVWVRDDGCWIRKGPREGEKGTRADSCSGYITHTPRSLSVGLTPLREASGLKDGYILHFHGYHHTGPLFTLVPLPIWQVNNWDNNYHHN